MPEGFNCLKMLYLVSTSDIRTVPPVAGVYVLHEARRLYCGASENLRRRFPETLGEQRFGHQFAYFPEYLIDLPNPDRVFAHLEVLETNTIAALHTIIYGNGLPLDLTNIKDVSWLPGIAWSRNADVEYRLAIDIARTALFAMGVPLHMSSLPHYGIFRTGLMWRMREVNRTEWNNILAGEVASRKSAEYARPPLVLVGR